MRSGIGDVVYTGGHGCGLVIVWLEGALPLATYVRNI